MIEHVVNILNEAVDADPAALNAMMRNRVPCNAELADHPTIVVEPMELAGKEHYTLGLVGLLNGLFGDEEKRIVSCWADDGSGALVGFRVVNAGEFKIPEA